MLINASSDAYTAFGVNPRCRETDATSAVLPGGHARWRLALGITTLGRSGIFPLSLAHFLFLVYGRRAAVYAHCTINCNQRSVSRYSPDARSSGRILGYNSVARGEVELQERIVPVNDIYNFGNSEPIWNYIAMFINVKVSSAQTHFKIVSMHYVNKKVCVMHNAIKYTLSRWKMRVCAKRIAMKSIL